MFKLQGRKSACTTWGQQRNSPIANPIFGSKYGPQKWSPELNHIFIPSFRSLLGPCFWDPDLVKVGSAIGEFCCCRRVLQADLRRISMSVIFFPSFASVALARSSHSVCADERIGQCMNKHPSLGSRKRSADRYVVRSHQRSDVISKTGKTQNPPTKHNHHTHKQAKPNNKAKKSPHERRAPSRQAANRR